MDKRIRKSQEQIATAFWQLWAEQGLSTITVTQIIKKANVNRSTFYAHYQDKIDLLEQLENELLQEFYDIFQQNISKTDALHNHLFHDYIREMCQYLYSHQDQLRLILNDQNEFLFQTAFQNLCKQAWSDHNITPRFKIPQKYVESIVPVMISQTIVTWLRTSSNNIEELMSVLDTVLSMSTEHLI